MIITVLWEDSSGVDIKGFGPHEFLRACLVEAYAKSHTAVAKQVRSVPRKGNGNVVAELKKDLERWGGPVCAALDHDKAPELLKTSTNCFSVLTQALRDSAPGDYGLVFLVKNVESMIEVACAAIDKPLGNRKPKPTERDLLLKEASRSAAARQAVLDQVAGFQRLVSWVADKV